MSSSGMVIGTILAIAALGIACATEAREDETTMSKKLETGDQAPAFSLPGSDGKTHNLADHAGRRPVVLAWFPKAFTGG